MAVIVQKYGGSSVADPELLRKVAQRIVATREQGYQVVVVVSAMGKTTDQLMALARQVSPDPGRRELDMLLSVGERISMSLLSMAINDLGYRAISFTGSQSGIITDSQHFNARILEVRPVRLIQALEEGYIVIVAGYQGVSQSKEVTTLGRGGSDTTAIALAAALEAECCEICSDVDGVYSADPREIAHARRIDGLSYEEMLALSHAGAKVLNAEAVRYAQAHGIVIHTPSTFRKSGYSVITESALERKVPIALTTDRSLLGFEWRADHGELITKASRWLQDSGLEARCMEVSESSSGGSRFRAWVRSLNVPDVKRVETSAKETFGHCFRLRRDIGTVTIIGAELGRYPGLLARGLAVLQRHGVSLESFLQEVNSQTFFLPLESLDSVVGPLYEELIGKELDADSMASVPEGAA